MLIQEARELSHDATRDWSKAHVRGAVEENDGAIEIVGYETPAASREGDVMSIPSCTRQLVGLREFATRAGLSPRTLQRWWQEGQIIGRRYGRTRSRVSIPVEVVDYYLHIGDLPTKLDLYQRRLLAREYLLDLAGPDGGLRELASVLREDHDQGSAASR